MGFYPFDLASHTGGKDNLEKLDFLLSCDPEAASMPISTRPHPWYNWELDGCLPLHLACSTTKMSLDSVKRLLCAYPKAIETKDRYGKLPLIVAMTSDKTTANLNYHNITGAARLNEARAEVVAFLKEEQNPLTTKCMVISYN